MRRLFFLIATTLMNIDASHETPTCVTFDGLEGRCVPLKRCNWIMSKAIVMKDQNECAISPNSLPLVCCAKWINAANCGRIGSSLHRDKFPWVVDVFYRRKRSFIQLCAGSLVNSLFVLTAAHCISDLTFIFKPYSVRVRRDDHTLKDYEILKSFIHPKYNKYSLNKEHDIALIKLTEAVSFDEQVQPICLPQIKDENILTEGNLLTIFSKGPIITGPARRQKHPITIPLRKSSVCDRIYKDVRVELGIAQICVGGEPGKDSCPGDSGGPLMQQVNDSCSNRWIQVGLVSLGLQKCGGKIPGIYVRLADYVEWIEATVDHVDWSENSLVKTRICRMEE